MPRGKNYLNNNRGVYLTKAANSKIPECTYGAACTRPDCIYKHSRTNATVASADPCMAFLAGYCAFGNNCRKRHPPSNERERLLQKYKQRPCKYGQECQTKGCLYGHSSEEVAAAAVEYKKNNIISNKSNNAVESSNNNNTTEYAGDYNNNNTTDYTGDYTNNNTTDYTGDYNYSSTDSYNNDSYNDNTATYGSYTDNTVVETQAPITTTVTRLPAHSSWRSAPLAPPKNTTLVANKNNNTIGMYGTSRIYNTTAVVPPNDFDMFPRGQAEEYMPPPERR